MKLLKERDLILQVTKRWRRQYPESSDQDKQIIYEKLCQLNLETVTAKEINDIIGNRTWTTAYCSECHSLFGDGIIFGEDGNMTLVCLDCFKAAITLFNKE